MRVEQERRARCGTTFRRFVENVRPTFCFYRHCDELARVLDQVSAGTIKRLMVFMPPRHGKSEMICRLYPAHYLFKNPTHHVGITSYAADLAYGLSRDARDHYLETGRQLSPSAEGKIEWHTHEGGRCWSAGVGGPITGKGGNLLIIDDPVKNEEEAYSELQRNKVWDWYQHTFYTRLEPNGAIILVMTRWHADDLAGRLLAEEKNSTNNEHWVIVNFEALKEKQSQQFPKTCVVIPDWRKPGEALCPERYDAERLQKIMKQIGSRAAQALYQQNPIDDEGNIWKLAWFRKYNDEMLRVRGIKLSDEAYDWDLAYGDEKDEKNAASAWVRSFRGSDGFTYIDNCDFNWLEFPSQVALMESIHVPHYVEAKGPGKSAVQALRRLGQYAREVQVKAIDKTARTILATPTVEKGWVFIHERIWEKLLLDERQGILGFPNRPFKDLNDAFVQMIHRRYPYPVREEEDTRPKTIEDYLQRTVFDKHLKKMVYKTNPDAL